VKAGPISWNISYKGMEIAEGAKTTKNNLLRYCELDTMAMGRIFERLLEFKLQNL